MTGSKTPAGLVGGSSDFHDQAGMQLPRSSGEGAPIATEPPSWHPPQWTRRAGDPQTFPGRRPAMRAGNLPVPPPNVR